MGRSQNRTLRMSLARSPETGSVQKTVLDRAETIDFWLPQPEFTQKSEQSCIYPRKLSATPLIHLNQEAWGVSVRRS